MNKDEEIAIKVKEREEIRKDRLSEIEGEEIAIKVKEREEIRKNRLSEIEGEEMGEERIKEEDDEGNSEYKWKLVGVSEERMKHLITQMGYRLNEGQGETIYTIGVKDNGKVEGISEEEYEETIENIRKIAKELNASVSVICEKYIEGKKDKKELGKEYNVLRGKGKKKVGELLIRKYGNEKYSEIRIAVCGNVDSGKSTLIGVLTRGELDNGRGSARSNIFVHKHELETGRTSSISHQIMGYDSKGNMVNEGKLNQQTWSEIVDKSSKICTFMDMAGHEKYLKTTVYGMTGNIPDYVCLVIGANMGISKMTKEHLGICLALKIPFFICITKLDICPKNIQDETILNIQKILKLPGVRKIPYIIKNNDDIISCVKNIQSNRLVPIFMISNVSGFQLDFLRLFLNLLPLRSEWLVSLSLPPLFVIDHVFQVSGVGTVVSGLTLQGSISIGQPLLLGPDFSGNYHSIVIKSIHRKRVHVNSVHAGQSACFSFKSFKLAPKHLRSLTDIDSLSRLPFSSSILRQGMVILDPSLSTSVWQFQAEVYIMYHSTTIKENYQSVIHCSFVRQSAKIISLHSEALRTGDKSLVTFRFLYRPEFLRVGDRFIFREGNTKGLGLITRLS